MLDQSQRVYDYIFKPLTYSNMYIKLARAFQTIKKHACALENPEYNYQGEHTPLYIVVDKTSTVFDELMSLVVDSQVYYDHYQIGGLDSNLVVIVLEVQDSKVIDKFKKGLYSKMYNKRTVSSSQFRLMYIDNPLKNMDFNKAYYAMEHSTDFFDKYIYPLVKSLDRRSIKEAKENEYDCKPEPEELLLNVEELKKLLNNADQKKQEKSEY